MGLSKKYYIQIAKIIAFYRSSKQSDGQENAEHLRGLIAVALANYFQDDNGNFNKEKFLIACEVIK